MLDAHPLALQDPAKIQAAATYNAAADHFDQSPLAFWDRYGRATVDRLNLQQGHTVLDVGCGTGASAIPAAEYVGPLGHVIGVDLAEELLKLARQKVSERRLSSTDFQLADMTDLEFPESHFDAVVSVFSLFFVPDMAAQVKKLWGLVKPGGVLAVTTWGKGFCEPATSLFWQSVSEVRPDLVRGFNPWDEITTPAALKRLFQEGGIPDSCTKIARESGWQRLERSADWWTVVLGSGFRGTVEQLSYAEKGIVRETCIRRVRDKGVTDIRTNVLYAVARK